jgi:hypothetical protein
VGSQEREAALAVGRSGKEEKGKERKRKRTGKEKEERMEWRRERRPSYRDFRTDPVQMLP